VPTKLRTDKEQHYPATNQRYSDKSIYLVFKKTQEPEKYMHPLRAKSNLAMPI
jgi:hypothetical protein